MCVPNPQKRTWISTAVMSALCQKQTFCALRQRLLFDQTNDALRVERRTGRDDHSCGDAKALHICGRLRRTKSPYGPFGKFDPRDGRSCQGIAKDGVPVELIGSRPKRSPSLPAEWGSGVSMHSSNPRLAMSALGQK